MPATVTKEEVVRSLQSFKDAREAFASGGVEYFNYHLSRFVDFCERDEITSDVISAFDGVCEVDSKEFADETRQTQRPPFPKDLDAEMCARWTLIRAAAEDDDFAWRFGMAFGGNDIPDYTNHFRTLVVRPFVKEMSRRMGDAAKLAPPEARDVQAVPYDRIPAENEVKIFLSHKTVDKVIVEKYHRALLELGYSPWLDKEDMVAGSNVERDILQGFEESCAAVFFVTKSFKDEKFLATEVDYAVQQKRDKGDKFSIITLLFDPDAEVPGVLRRFLWQHVSNDLDGLYEVLRGLPVELGPVRWKAGVAK
ncbi:MAG: toll/interleukin-1 receptor domain-containing protein [Bacteroidota bacterium]